MLPPHELSREIRYGSWGARAGSAASSVLLPECTGPTLPPHHCLCRSPAPLQVKLLSSGYSGPRFLEWAVAPAAFGEPSREQEDPILHPGHSHPSSPFQPSRCLIYSA